MGATVLIVVVLAVLIFSIYKDESYARRRKQAGEQIENIRAQLMLLSTDHNEIYEFLMLKEPYISQDLIQQLINRITELRIDENVKTEWRALREEKPTAINIEAEPIQSEERMTT